MASQLSRTFRLPLIPLVVALAVVLTRYVQGQPAKCSTDALAPTVLACLSNNRSSLCCTGIAAANTNLCFCDDKVLESGRELGVTAATVQSIYKGCGNDVDKLSIKGVSGCPGDGKNGTAPPPAPLVKAPPPSSKSTNGSTTGVCDQGPLLTNCGAAFQGAGQPTKACCDVLSPANAANCFCTDDAARLLAPMKARIMEIKASCNDTSVLNVKNISGCSSAPSTTPSPAILIPAGTPNSSPPPPPSSAIARYQQGFVGIVTLACAMVAFNLRDL